MRLYIDVLGRQAPAPARRSDLYHPGTEGRHAHSGDTIALPLRVSEPLPIRGRPRISNVASSHCSHTAQRDIHPPALGQSSHFAERQPLSLRTFGTPTTLAHVGGHRFPSMPQPASPRQRRARVNVSRRNACAASPLGKSAHLGKSRLAHGRNDHVAPTRARGRAAPRDKMGLLARRSCRVDC
jgi:hypothetical protein